MFKRFNAIFSLATSEVKTPLPKLFRSNKIEVTTVEVVNNTPQLGVWIRCESASVRVYACTSADLYDFVKERFYAVNRGTFTMPTEVMWAKLKFYLCFNGKPLSRNNIPLVEYNIRPCDIIDYVPACMLGGSHILPTYQIISECEKQIIEEDARMRKQDLHLQSFSYNIAKILINCGDVDIDWTVKLCEDIFVFIYQLVRSTSKCDYGVAVANFIKLRTGRSIFGDLLNSKDSIFGSYEYLKDMIIESFPEPLVLQSFEDWLHTARSGVDEARKFKNSPMMNKLNRIAMYGLALGLFDKIGVTMDKCRYGKLEQEAMKRKFFVGPDFALTIIDTLIFLCETGYQCMKLGSIEPIFHSGSEYEAWIVKAQELARNSILLNNPEPHNIDRFSFLADLNEVIEKGDAIVKFISKEDKSTKAFVGKILSDLKMIKANETTKRAAQQDRDAPFSVLLFGGSSIGKSTLTKLLFYHYGKIFNLPTGSEFKYTRNPVDQFWSGFNSTQWCVQLDDIAFMHPNSASAGDPSIMEMLQVINSVPYVPNQAELADKGRTPLRAKFVIATTNTEMLNTQYYFSCPLAVNRRLPWVLDVKPKAEYTKNSVMLDSTLVPEIQDGEYPDYWIWTVKKVVPRDERRVGAQARLETVEIFNNVYDFLMWFSKVAKHAAEVNAQVSTCDKTMADVVLCDKGCYLPVSHCRCLNLQSSAITAPQLEWVDQVESYDSNNNVSYFESFIAFCIQMSIYIFYNVFLARWFVNAFILNYYIKQFLCYLAHKTFGKSRTTRIIVKVLGNKMQRKVGKVNLLIKIVSILAAGSVAYKLISSIYKSIFGDINVNDFQNDVRKRGYAPVARENERKDVWYKSDFELTTFDVPDKSGGYRGLELSQFHKMILKNVVRMEWIDNDVVKRTTAFCIGGHVYVMNNHTIPSDGLMVKVSSLAEVNGINSNITIKFCVSDCVIKSEKDLVFFRIRNVPPKKNLRGLFATQNTIGNFNGHYVGKDKFGAPWVKQVRKIQRHNKFYCEPLKHDITMWSGFVDEATVKGDCGSPLILESAYGPIIAGIHFLSDNEHFIGCICITEEDIDEVMSGEYADEIIVESASPLLSAPSAPREVIDLHFKSPLRYMEDGTANVYGSFAGWKGAMKSRVEKSVIADRIAQEGYTCKFGKPVMSGWEPWHIALKEMVKPVTKLDVQLLKDCTDNFVKDILQGLPVGALDDVHVYDDFTAINGAPGVAFVDKINRNTSAGAPYNKCKKYFLRAIPGVGECHDPVEVDAEIMDRVQACIKGYEQGERFMPVFKGHLKDEALKFSKIEAKKTRVFTGAPFDWTIVVRKYLLSTIRLIQNNRYVFEAGPGTIAQSIEWEHMREYLVQFGEDRMVAGDYAAFDKSMPSTIILAAFDILKKICEASGNYSPNDMRVLAGIANDTAFPLVDFNGDLVEFYGSNPSGHPLTVIINSLANALYMRYCYARLNPTGNCKDFKSNVALMTYGDDNVMGVSRNCDFFHHTAIQNELAAIGIKYTMADKEAASIPFIHIDEVSFLKRTWRYDADVGAFLCPLEHASIEKMLMIGVASKTISREAQAIAVISSAVREYFFYGKKTFEKRSEMLKKVVSDCDLQLYVETSTFPTWEELKKQFWDASQYALNNRA